MNERLTFRDDADKDYRNQWELPVHFLWDQNGLAMIDLLGYLQLVRELMPPPPQDVLDVGCGDGYVAAVLSRDGYRITGIDYCPRAITFARILAPNSTFYVHDIRSLKNAEWLHNKFRVALLIEVLEHIPPVYHVDSLEGIGCCLGKGGKLFVSVPSERMPMISLDYKHFSTEELATILDKGGFAVEHVVFQHEIHYLFSPKFWRWLCNSYYDLKVLRRGLHRLFMARFNRARDSTKAGRLIVQATRKQ